MAKNSAELAFVEQIRRGDDAAWREFIYAYEGRLAAFVRCRLHDPAAVDDVVQETLIGFLVSLPNYDAARDLETYLFSIAAHKLTDHLRRQGRRPALPLTIGDDTGAAEREPADSSRSAGSMVRSHERRTQEESALARALSEVLDRLRAKREFVKLACLELLFVRGRSNKDTAELLEIGEQAVANYKFDFISKLRENLHRQKLPADMLPRELNN